MDKPITPNGVLWAIVTVAFLLWPGAHAQITTSQYDNARTGAYLNEKTLTPQNVNSKQFGRIFKFTVDGDVYAQPLYVPGVEIPGQGNAQRYLHRYRKRQRLRLRRRGQSQDAAMAGQFRAGQECNSGLRRCR